VHFESWPDEEICEKWIDETLKERWASLAAVREMVLKKIEEKRADGAIGASLEAAVTVVTNDTKVMKVLKEHKDFLRYLFIVSQVNLKEGDTDVVVEKAKGEKCSRCWNYSEAVGSDPGHPALCERCVKNI
jgi:isoleucyl-tRNA synthetase